MAHNTQYTITTLQSNLSQLDKRVFTQATNARIRLGYAPYTVVRTKDGSEQEPEVGPKFPFGAFEPDGDGIKKINRD
tara:strand:+ start:157 stop:387 length:231 start_codon:yes stop_codon:yes gene_type:complete